MSKVMNDQPNQAEELHIPEKLPLLPLQDGVVYPFMRLQLAVEREGSIAAVQQALMQERLVFVVAQRQMVQGEHVGNILYDVGTICIILQSIPQERGLAVLIQGLVKARVARMWGEGRYLTVSVERAVDPTPSGDVREQALVRNVLEKFTTIVSAGDAVPADLIYFLQKMNDPATVAYAVAANVHLSVAEAQAVLESSDATLRLQLLYNFLTREAEVVSMQNRIRSAADEEIRKHQKEYYLREQLRAIQNELGDGGGRTEMSDLREKLAARIMPETAKKEALRQLQRLERMPQEGPEAETVRNYLEWMAELPWDVTTEDAVDIGAARRILDEDHAFLEKVKERILEFLAVHKLKRSSKGSIICFVGPPGVGKTSLGKSIARAMGRKFVRISLGGVHDEADIRGHRRTYIGAMPGRIIYALKQVGTRNPVFMLDEVDKIGSDFRGGDPYSALLEVLDPEQNNSFTDHFLNVPFDLSDVVFITTANTLEGIPSPLLDRMEVIPLAGYTEEEKLDIALRYLVKRQIEANGLSPEQVAFDPEAIITLIAKYTREAGLRNLERAIGKICRQIAKKVAEGEEGTHLVTPAAVEEMSGIPPFHFDVELEENMVGTVTGLAWTPAGGEILFVEATAMAGSPSLRLTGSLGDVMKESAEAALSYIRANADRFRIPADRFRDTSMHIHVPAGALPKDGPSAGVTMATAILSTLTRTPVRREVAMTGEITLRGKVLPIGGLKEKILGAIRAGIKVVVIPEDNVRDLDDISPQILDKIRIIPAKNVDDVFNAALTNMAGAEEEKDPPSPVQETAPPAATA